MCAAAAAHYDKAINTYRQAMSNVTRQNCEVLFGFSTFVAIYSWVSSDFSGDLFFVDPAAEGTDNNIAYVHLLRGILPLLEVSHQWLINGPLEYFLTTLEYEIQEKEEVVAASSAKFDALDRLWNPDLSSTLFTSLEIEAFRHALGLLKDVYNMIHYGGENVDAVGMCLGWPIRTHETYIDMVNRRQPEALILLAHYCLLLGHVDEFWYMRGMSRRLLRSIHRVLGKEWES